eukprot:TRINITY_DN5741_c0_g1_i1.p1 TRINITY_DN5741_c0_g1~~TRINITY_DN5741_c0_g1_i1.p1  ORF type:complete len:497 (-),score=110.96 TRINITY_DN5741_c0_g1_i1:84-1574(-)
MSSSLLSIWNNLPISTSLSDIAQQASTVISSTSNTIGAHALNITNGLRGDASSSPTTAHATPTTKTPASIATKPSKPKPKISTTPATAKTASTTRSLPTTRDKSELFQAKRSEIMMLEVAKQNSILKKLYDERKREVEKTKTSVKAMGVSSSLLKMVSIARSAASCTACSSMVKLYEYCVACSRKFCSSCYQIYDVEIPVDIRTDAVKELVKFLLCKDCGSCVKSLQKKQEWLENKSMPTPLLYMRAEEMATRRNTVAQLIAKYEYFVSGILSPPTDGSKPTANDDTKIEETIHEQIMEYENKLMVDITRLREELDLFRGVWPQSDMEEEMKTSIVEMTEELIESMIASFHNLQRSKAMNDITQLQRMYILLLQLMAENSTNPWYKKQYSTKYSALSEAFLKVLHQWMKEEMFEGEKRFQEFTTGLSRLKREPNAETLLSGPASEMMESALLRENIRILRTRFLRLTLSQIGKLKGEVLLNRIEQLLNDVESSYQI